MDENDRKISNLLAEDSRRSLADIGSAVGLSPSAVNERIRRLVATGAIRRFTVEAEPDAFGRSVLAFIFVGLNYEAGEDDFKAFVGASPNVMDCHHVTGSWSYLIKLRVGSMAEIEQFLQALKERRFLARSETMLALSTVVEKPLLPE